MNSYRTENYIKDKVIVITGASSGFGKETAKKAAELGGKVVLAARREELLREITQEIRESGGEASYIKTDVRVKDQVNAMAKFADLHALFRPEREAAKSSGIGRKIDKYNSPYNGNNHDAERNPDCAFRHNIAGKLLQDSCEHR